MRIHSPPVEIELQRPIFEQESPECNQDESIGLGRTRTMDDRDGWSNVSPDVSKIQ
jgi:hypothetical protein